MARVRWFVSVVGVIACTFGAMSCGSGGDAGTSFGAGGSGSSGGSGGAATSSGSGGGSGGGSTSGGGNTSTSSGSGAGASGSGGGTSASGGTSGSGSSGSGSSGARDGGSGSSSGGAGSSSGSGSGGSSSSSGGGGTTGTCGAGDTNLPAEPTIPSACSTLQATQNVASGGLPSESNMDTSAIQSALNSCGGGKAVKLAASGSNNAFITGPLTVPAGVTLWVDAGTTLYGTRSTSVYGSAAALITVKGSNAGIVGDGVIDGQGGEPNVGSSSSFWDANSGSGGNSPALIEARNVSNFTMYRVTLQNSPKFHVKLGAAGFVVWGVTIKTPSKATNSAGTALTHTSAHNTDGIDPGEAASNGFIVCSRIDTGDDHIAIKGSSSTGVSNLVIAHNHFEAGHGMSIGSEFTGGVSNINVYDLSIDGTNAGTSGGSSNGIRIKSDSSRGGLVNNVTYSDVCVRDLSNPILLTPFYSTATGSSIPQFTNIKIQNFHGVTGGSNTPKVTLAGFDAAHTNSVTLDNVVIDGISASNVTASYTNITLGPGNVNFTPSGTGVNVTNGISGSSTPNPCTNKWVTF